MLRTLSGRDLMKIGKRRDQVAKERAAEAAAPTAEQRAEAVERESRRLRGLLRRRPSG